MKKLITTTAFLILGTVAMTAQTTKKKNTPSTMPEKPAGSTEMKMETNVQPNGMNRTIDTATMNNQSKMQTNPKTSPNNGTLQSPGTTMPNNGTMQNPNTTIPNNSTATPQLQPVSPVDATKPTR